MAAIGGLLIRGIPTEEQQGPGLGAQAGTHCSRGVLSHSDIAGHGQIGPAGGRLAAGRRKRISSSCVTSRVRTSTRTSTMLGARRSPARRLATMGMPDAADARLASLTLSGVDIGEFDPGRTEYEAVVADGVTATTVEAAAAQDDAVVGIDTPDADGEADGHQVALQDLGEITVTVTSADGSRTKTYRVRLGEEEAAGPVAGCLRGDIAVGFNLVVYAGGSIEDLVACAEGRNVAALYTLDSGEWVSYIVGAPELVNRSFAGLFAEGLAALTPLIARSDGPASPDPAGAATRTGDATQPWPACLQGEIAEGFNLVVYEGGSVGELEACAEGVGLAALYALSDGLWVSYILGAPEFVNRSFAALFADGVPSATPLVGKRN